MSSRRATVFVGLASVSAILLSAGCERDPLDTQCPAIAAGDVVLSELRGPQSGGGGDTYGQWFEFYNTTGADVDLGGLHVIMTRIDGGAAADILVRPGSTIKAGGYAVLGRFDLGAEPAHVDFGYLPAGCSDQDTSKCPGGLTYGDSIYNAGAIELVACGTVVDKIIFRELPSSGTWSYDGALTPDATANDTESDWCVDNDDSIPDPTQLGLRGTPGEANRTCPTL